MVKRLFRAAVLLLLVSVQLSAEKVSATTIINRNPIGLGEKVYLTIDVTYDDVSKVEVTKSTWPDGLALLTGPTIRTFYDATDSSNPRRVRIYYSFRGDRLGRIVVNPITVTAGDAVAMTEPFVVGVGLWRSQEVYVPVLCRWRIDTPNAIAGQAVRVVLMLYDMIDIPAIGSVLPPRVEGAIVDSINELGPLERVSAGLETIYQLPIAAYLVTPSRSGVITLPSVSVLVGDTRAESNTEKIQVAALPQTIQESGAIGFFRYIVQLPESEIEAGTEVVASVRIEGTGNLNYLNLPVPTYEGFVLVGLDEHSDYTSSLDGYVGSRESTYRLLAQTVGSAEIQVPEFSWIDVEGEVSVEEERSALIQVTAAEVDIKPPEDFPFALETATEISSHRRGFAYVQIKNYFWLVPGIIGFAVLLILKKARIILVGFVALFVGAGQFDSDSRIDTAITAYENDEYDRADELFGQLLMELPGNPGLLYNRSLSRFREDQTIPALHDIRLAIKRAPSNRKYRDFATWINLSADLPDVVFPSQYLDPDLLYYLFMCFALIGTAFALAQLVKNRGVFVIASVLSIFLAVASFGTLAYVHEKNTRISGIVHAGGAAVRSIPNSTAGVRIEFDAGASMRVVDESDGFFLVESGAGISGWIRVETLYID